MVWLLLAVTPDDRLTPTGLLRKARLHAFAIWVLGVVFGAAAVLTLSGCSPDDVALTSLCVASGDFVACDVRATSAEGADICGDIGGSLLVVDSMVEQQSSSAFAAHELSAPMWWIDGQNYECAMQNTAGAWMPRGCDEVAPVLCELPANQVEKP